MSDRIVVAATIGFGLFAYAVGTLMWLLIVGDLSRTGTVLVAAAMTLLGFLGGMLARAVRERR